MIRSRLLVLLGVVALLCVVGLSSRANVAAPAAGIKWEYKVLLTNSAIEKDIEEALNKAGADGWELAGVFNDVHGARVRTNGYLILKRQKQ